MAKPEDLLLHAEQETETQKRSQNLISRVPISEADAQAVLDRFKAERAAGNNKGFAWAVVSTPPAGDTTKAAGGKKKDETVVVMMIAPTDLESDG